MAILITLLQGLWVQFVQIAPYWAVGLVFGSIVSVYMTDKIVDRVSALNNDSFNPVAVTIASLLGIASPLCMYGTIPLIAALGRKKVAPYILTSFMISSILLNPNLLILSFSLGAQIALLRFLLCIIGGVLAGFLIWLFCKGKNPLRYDKFEEGYTKKKRTFFSDLLRNFTVTAPYFLIGILITALYDVFFPKEWMTAVLGGNQAFGTLFAASLSVPLYACGGGTIPLLLAWLRDGMSVGSAISFMLAGPATKFTNLSAVKILLGTKNFIIYLAYCIFFATASGLIIDLII